MAPGSWGDIAFKTTTDGSYIGRVSYRTLDGHRREATATAGTKIGVDRKLKLKLPTLIAAAATPPAHAPVTFEMVVSEWLRFEELKLADHLKARGTHAEHLRMIRPEFRSVLSFWRMDSCQDRIRTSSVSARCGY